MSQIVPDRVNEQSPAPMDVSPDGHESVSVFGKVKNKAKKMRDKVKAQYDHRHDDKVEEEESEEDEYQNVDKPDENVEGVTKGMAGLGGLGTANKDERPNQESGNANKSSLKDLLGKNDGMLTDEPMKPSESPVEPHPKDGVFTEAKENPKEDLSYFKETEEGGGKRTEAEENPKEDSSYFKETEQGGGKRGDAILTPEKEKKETDVGAPSITQRAGVAMAGATGGILGFGKGNKQEGVEEEKPNPSEFDKPPNSSEFEAPPVGLKEVPKPLEEEFQSLLEKSRGQQSDAVEGNGLSSDEKPTGEAKSGASSVTKKASGLFQGLRSSFTSDQGKKDATVPEEQSRETQDAGKQSEEGKGGQSYAEKLYAAKNVISSKLGYGVVGPPEEEKAAYIEESKGEEKLQDPKTEEGTENKETPKSSIFPNLSKDAISAKLGYGGLPDKKEDSFEAPRGEDKEEAAFEAPRGEDKEEVALEEPRGVEESKAEEKVGEEAAFEAPPRGEDKEEAAFEEPRGVEESKGEEKVGDPKEGGVENKETFKSTLVSKLSPGEDDKALSEVITEAFSSSARSILGGFYGGSPKEVPPPPPSSANEGPAELPKNNDPPQNSTAPKGIVGRVTGVVSSFIGKKPKEDGDHISSPLAQDPTSGDHKEEDLTGSSEAQTGNQIEQGTK